MPVEAISAFSFSRGKGFVKRRAPMAVQVVLNQINLVSLRKVDVGQLFENMSIVDGGASGPNGDIAPALMRSEYHEQAGDAVALVFIVRPRRLTRSHRDGGAGFFGQLFGDLVKADQRARRVVWACVDVEHLFHGRDKSSIGFGGITQ